MIFAKSFSINYKKKNNQETKQIEIKYNIIKIKYWIMNICSNTVYIKTVHIFIKKLKII